MRADDDDLLRVGRPRYLDVQIFDRLLADGKGLLAHGKSAPAKPSPDVISRTLQFARVLHVAYADLSRKHVDVFADLAFNLLFFAVELRKGTIVGTPRHPELHATTCR